MDPLRLARAYASIGHCHAAANAQRIESAAERIGPERIRFVHPDCGFWMLPRSVANAKMRSHVAGRDLCEGSDAS